jgi:hypothetical protein
VSVRVKGEGLRCNCTRFGINLRKFSTVFSLFIIFFYLFKRISCYLTMKLLFLSHRLSILIPSLLFSFFLVNLCDKWIETGISIYASRRLSDLLDLNYSN